MKTFITKHLVYLTIALLVGVGSVYAIGTLTPSGTAGDDTHYSLNDIYDKLVDFSDTPTATSSPFSVPGSVTASFRTLTEIYNLLTAEEDDLVAENIRDGVTVFGVEGELEEGSDPNASGPFVSLGGSLGYQDENTGLIWQAGNGGFMTWYQATEYCQKLMMDGVTVSGSVQNVWRTPTPKEYHSIILYDRTFPASALPGTDPDYHWSTPYVDDDGQAWVIDMIFGGMNYSIKEYDLAYARCVR